jgi:hypothetical protein
MWRDICYWTLNTVWRREWRLWSEVCDWVANTDWRSVWDDCWVWFVIWESIHNDGVSGTTVERSLWLDWEQRLTDWVGRLLSEVCVWTENTDLRIQWDVSWVRFVICLWIQIDGVFGMTFEWILLVDNEYRLTELVWKLWSEVCDWNVNTDWRSYWEKTLMRFMIEQWIQTDGVNGTTVELGLCFDFEYRLTEEVGRMLSKVCDRRVYTDWRSEWDDCRVRYVIGLWIQADEVSGTAVEWRLLLESEYSLTVRVGKLWIEVWDWIVNTDWRFEWDDFGLRFEIGLWI